jgi:hypothetical protein
MKNVVIASDHGHFVVVDEFNWKSIEMVQNGTDTLGRTAYQFNGIIPGLIDEDGSIPYIRCCAVYQDLSAPITDRWHLTTLRVGLTTGL